MADMFVAKQVLTNDICGHPDCFNRRAGAAKIAVVQNLGPIIKTPHGDTHTKCFFRHLANSEKVEDLAPSAVEEESND